MPYPTSVDLSLLKLHNIDLEAVTVVGKPIKTKKFTVFTGLSSPVIFSVFTHTPESALRTILERVFFVKVDGGFAPPPQPDAHVFNTRMSDFYEELRRQIRPVRPMTRDEFVDSYADCGRKRTRYAAAVVVLKSRILTRRDAVVKAFLKTEKLDFTTKTTAQRVERLISERSDVYKVENGRYLKPLEKKIFKLINGMFSSVTLFKGLNAAQQGKYMHQHWTHFNHPVAFSSDLSRCDQHISKIALMFEHSIYKLFYPQDKYIAEILKMQLEGKNYLQIGKWLYKYYTVGGRKSGDYNTALGNALIVCALFWTYSKMKGVEVRLANNCDDSVTIMEQEHYEHYKSGFIEWWEEMGFTMKVEPPVYVFERIQFCQTQPVYDGCEWVMVRDPKCLSKDSLSIKPLNSTKLARRWAACVALGGINLTGGMPIWQEFYAWMGRFADGAKPLTGDPTQDTGLSRLSKGMARQYSLPTSDARLSFERAYGISPTAQVMIEKYYQTLKIGKGHHCMQQTTIPHLFVDHDLEKTWSLLGSRC